MQAQQKFCMGLPGFSLFVDSNSRPSVHWIRISYIIFFYQIIFPLYKNICVPNIFLLLFTIAIFVFFLLFNFYFFSPCNKRIFYVIFTFSIIIAECLCQISFDRIMFEKKKHVQTKGNWIYGLI